MQETREVKPELRRMAKECDQGPAVDISGYYATKHQLLPGCAMVWAPCGCCLVGNSHGEAVLTICQKTGCDFDWSAAVMALGMLEESAPPKDLEVRTKEEPDEEALARLVPSID